MIFILGHNDGLNITIGIDEVEVVPTKVYESL